MKLYPSCKLNLRILWRQSFRCSIEWAGSWCKCSCLKLNNKMLSLKMSRSKPWIITKRCRKWRNMKGLLHLVVVEPGSTWIRVRRLIICFHRWGLIYKIKFNWICRIMMLETNKMPHSMKPRTRNLESKYKTFKSRWQKCWKVKTLNTNN